MLKQVWGGTICRITLKQVWGGTICRITLKQVWGGTISRITLKQVWGGTICSKQLYFWPLKGIFNLEFSLKITKRRQLQTLNCITDPCNYYQIKYNLRILLSVIWRYTTVIRKWYIKLHYRYMWWLYDKIFFFK